MYAIHAASIDGSGLHLSEEPRATAPTLQEALVLARNGEYHGPEGVAVVTPDGATIYTAEQYEAAEAAAVAEAEA